MTCLLVRIPLRVVSKIKKKNYQYNDLGENWDDLVSVRKRGKWGSVSFITTPLSFWSSRVTFNRML